jgi:hypothetical protein
MMRRVFLAPMPILLAAVFGLAGCMAEEENIASSVRGLQGQQATFLEVEVESETHGPVSLDPPMTRPRRRVDIDQLNAAIQDVTGGIQWSAPITEENLFGKFSATLGKPDYALMTSENLSATALFQKFLNDAARQVCHKLMNRELNDPDAEKILFSQVTPEDTYAAAPDKIRANLKSLLLRFHGRYVQTDDPGIELWRWLYESAEHVGESPAIAWRTVCAGLISHPDFYLY